MCQIMLNTLLSLIIILCHFITVIVVTPLVAVRQRHFDGLAFCFPFSSPSLRLVPIIIIIIFSNFESLRCVHRSLQLQ